jgi:hypothetical protein
LGLSNTGIKNSSVYVDDVINRSVVNDGFEAHVMRRDFVSRFEKLDESEKMNSILNSSSFAYELVSANLNLISELSGLTDSCVAYDCPTKSGENLSLNPYFIENIFACYAIYACGSLIEGDDSAFLSLLRILRIFNASMVSVSPYGYTDLYNYLKSIYKILTPCLSSSVGGSHVDDFSRLLLSDPDCDIFLPGYIDGFFCVSVFYFDKNVKESSWFRSLFVNQSYSKFVIFSYYNELIGSKVEDFDFIRDKYLNSSYSFLFYKNYYGDKLIRHFIYHVDPMAIRRLNRKTLDLITSKNARSRKPLEKTLEEKTPSNCIIKQAQVEDF